MQAGRTGLADYATNIGRRQAWRVMPAAA